MAELLNDHEIKKILGSIIKEGREGYVRSERSGAPAGMRAADWEDSTTAEGPDALLDRVIQSGFPWNALGTRLKAIDQQFQTVTHEYAEIHDFIERLEKEVERAARAQDSFTDQIREVVRDELPAQQDRWLILAGGTLAVVAGIVISIVSSKPAQEILTRYGDLIGPIILVGGVGALLWATLRRRKRS